MFAAVWLLAVAAGSVDPTTVGPPKVDWTGKPAGPAFYRCLRPLEKGAQQALVTMRCVTAPNDHIDQCVVTSNSQASDIRYETAALCASKSFRMRATGPDGRPVMGVPVNVPYRFASPATYDAIVKSARP